MSVTDKAKRIYNFVLLTQMVSIIGFSMLCFGVTEPNSYKLVRYFIAISCAVSLWISTIKMHQRTGIFQLIFLGWLIYLLVSCLEIAFDGRNDYRHLKEFLTIWIIIYSIPLFMFIRPDVTFYKRLFKLCYTFSIIYIIFSIPIFTYEVVLPRGLSEAFTFMVEGAPILLLTLPYHSNKKQKYIFVGIILATIVMMLLGRRNKVVFYGGALVLSAILVLKNSNLSSKITFRYIVLIILLSIGILAFLDKFALFFDKVSLGMSSREQVIDDFFYDFNQHPSDWFWGRGIYGEFNGGILNNSADGASRDGIENGYLYLILKGGWIWLGLLILISINAIYKGLMKSKNMLCKGFAIIIILYFIDMIGFGIPGMTIKYMMVFIAIAGCNSPWLRQLSDSYLKEKIGLR